PAPTRNRRDIGSRKKAAKKAPAGRSRMFMRLYGRDPPLRGRAGAAGMVNGELLHFSAIALHDLRLRRRQLFEIDRLGTLVIAVRQKACLGLGRQMLGEY